LFHNPFEFGIEVAIYEEYVEHALMVGHEDV
jgi:hypothetical protein